MTHSIEITRRGALAMGLAVSFAGSAWAVAPAVTRKKLVVILNRGGMDGMSSVPPLNDSNYFAERGVLALEPDDLLKFDADFGLHPSLKNIASLAAKGQARIAPAVFTPAGHPSHGSVQDVLENGTDATVALDSGWLNRTISAMGGHGAPGLYVGERNTPLLMQGAAQTTSWAPGALSAVLPAKEKLAALYSGDPLLKASLAKALERSSAMQRACNGTPVTTVRESNSPPSAETIAASGALGRSVGTFMAQDGPQIAAITIDGWDTHGAQGTTQGPLANRLADFDAVIGGLAEGLGPAWSDTIVMTVTEFGRILKVNDQRIGSEHGYAYASFLMGGALKRGGIVGDWPGMAPNDQHMGALAGTLDVRRLSKGVLHDHLGIDRQTLDTIIFPGSASLSPVYGLA